MYWRTLSGLFSANFLILARTNQPRRITPYSGLGLATLINHQGNSPKAWPYSVWFGQYIMQKFLFLSYDSGYERIIVSSWHYELPRTVVKSIKPGLTWLLSRSLIRLVSCDTYDQFYYMTLPACLIHPDVTRTNSNLVFNSHNCLFLGLRSRSPFLMNFFFFQIFKPKATKSYIFPHSFLILHVR